MTARAPYQAHSATSEAAAKAIAPALGDLRARVWAAVMASDAGLTDEEICERTGLEGNTVRPRRVELVSTGHLVESGKRTTKSGRLAVVWACPVPKAIPVARVLPSAPHPSGAALRARPVEPTGSGAFSAVTSSADVIAILRRR